MDFFREFMPHGHCYLWTPSILWTSVVSDVVIAASYFSIPLTLVYFARKRRNLPFSWVFVLFGIFILACGTGHVFEVWNTWSGAYGSQAIVKVITAVASVGTAVALWSLLPRVLALASPRQLAGADDPLREAVEEYELREPSRPVRGPGSDAWLTRSRARCGCSTRRKCSSSPRTSRSSRIRRIRRVSASTSTG